jgi:hypothetical protein
MLFKDIITFYSDKHIKPVGMFSGQNGRVIAL